MFNKKRLPRHIEDSKIPGEISREELDWKSRQADLDMQKVRTAVETADMNWFEALLYRCSQFIANLSPLR